MDKIRNESITGTAQVGRLTIFRSDKNAWIRSEMSLLQGQRRWDG